MNLQAQISSFHLSLITLGLLLSVPTAASQEFRGSISGRVTDSTGAEVHGAKLTITNIATKVSENTTTDDAGNYTVLYLTPGQYQIWVETPGFKKLERSGIELRIGDRLAVDLQLELGTIQQEVHVTAATPLLQTAEASAGQIIDQRRIEDLPLPDGDPFVLARISGGVTFTGNLLFARPFDNGGVSSIRASGAPGGNEFTLDGAPDMASQLRVGFVPPSDAVQEFKVITANFDAQQGHTAGAVVNVITKSGTDSFHGSAYEFDRNDALSANDFFSNRLGQPKQPLRYNRWGGTLGGPVFLPKLYNGRQKTFFFFAYEGLKDDQSEANRFTVPTQAERNGDLSALLAPAAGSITIYDAATGQPATGGHVTRSPLTCNGLANVICPDRLSPIAQAYLKLYPLPNLSGDAQGQLNYFSPNPRMDHFNSETLRVDQEITSKQKMFLRVYRNWREELRGNWSGTLGGVMATGNGLFRINDGAIYDEVYTLSPTMVLNFRLGAARFTEQNQRPSDGHFNPASLGWSPQVVSLFAGAKYLPRFNIEQFAALGDTAGDYTTFNVYFFQPTFTKIRGAHTFRFGYDFRSYRENGYAAGSQAGSYAFNGDFTRATDTSTSLFGQGLAAFLLGQPTGGSIDINTSRANQTLFQGVFFQDDWKVTRKLTLNLGLRYEYEGATTERFDRNTRGFDATDPSPIAAAAEAAYAANPDPALPASNFQVNGGLLFADSSNRGFWIPYQKNIQARLGFAYQLTNQIVLRGGWAIFAVPFITSAVNQTGFSESTSIVPSLDKGLTFQANLLNPWPGGVTLPLGSSLGLGTFTGKGINFVPLTRRNGQSSELEFNVQWQPGGNWMLQAAYIGLRACDLTTSADFSPIPASFLSTSPIRDQATINFLAASIPNPFAGLAPGTSLNGSTIARSQLLRPFPQFTGVGGVRNDGRGYYDALQISSEKRLSHGFTWTNSYTWSKTLDYTGLLNPTDTHFTKSISGNDTPQRFTSSFIWELPFGRGRYWGTHWRGATDQVLGGWQVGGIYYYQSGSPIALGNRVYFGDPTQLRTDISGGTVDNAFPTAGFYFSDAAVQTNGVVDPAKQRADKRIQLLNNIRTLPFTEPGFRGQPLNYWEGINVIKKISFREKLNLETRFSFQNAFNHPQFSNPNTDPTSSSFGKVTNQLGFSLPRNIEVGMKLRF